MLKDKSAENFFSVKNSTAHERLKKALRRKEKFMNFKQFLDLAANKIFSPSDSTEEDSKENGKLNIPKASTPTDVIVKLIALTISIGVLLYWLLGFPGVIVLFVVLAFTTTIYTQEVQEFHALTLLNNYTGIQRVLFQGRTGKLPWESVGTLVDLRTEIKDIPEETWATAAGALMEVKYIFMLHPKTTEKAILAFASFTHDTVKAAARNLFSTMLSDHFGLCEDPKKLLQKKKVNDDVFESDKAKEKIKRFEEKYGIKSSAFLEDVDYDPETQKARDIISKADSISEAIALLMAGKNGKAGMSQEVAEKTVRMLNIPGIQEYILSLNAKGVENLTSVVLGGIGGNK